MLLLKSGGLPEDTVAVIFFFLPVFNIKEAGDMVICGFMTVILQVFDTPSTVAVIAAVPFLCAVTIPSESTEATDERLDLHFGAMPDDTEAVICTEFFLYNDSDSWLRRISGFFTVTLHRAEYPSAEAVITVVPGFCPVTHPSASTEATDFLPVFHFTLVPFEVYAVSLKLWLCSSCISTEFSLISVGLTVITHDDELFFAFTVMAAVPAFLAVTIPYLFTDAIFELLLLNEGNLPDGVNADK